MITTAVVAVQMPFSLLVLRMVNQPLLWVVVACVTGKPHIELASMVFVDYGNMVQ
jgi:hypothetical protein